MATFSFLPSFNTSPTSGSPTSMASELADLRESRRRRSEELSRSIRKKKKEEALRNRRSLSPVSPTSLAIDFQAIPDLVKTMMETSDDETLIDKLLSIQEAISVDIYASASKTVVSSGGLDVLVPLLERTDSHRLQYEAGRVLAKICETDLADAVFDENPAVHSLVAMLTSANGYVKETAAHCLGLLAKHRAEYRDHLLEFDIASIL